MAYLKNRVSLDVIGGELVTRYNGNNCSRSNQGGGLANRKRVDAAKITDAQKKAAKRRHHESATQRRLLDG